jgi:hypothetical protein
MSSWAARPSAWIRWARGTSPAPVHHTPPRTLASSLFVYTCARAVHLCDPPSQSTRSVLTCARKLPRRSDAALHSPPSTLYPPGTLIPIPRKSTRNHLRPPPPPTHLSPTLIHDSPSRHPALTLTRLPPTQVRPPAVVGGSPKAGEAPMEGVEASATRCCWAAVLRGVHGPPVVKVYEVVRWC